MTDIRIDIGDKLIVWESFVWFGLALRELDEIEITGFRSSNGRWFFKLRRANSDEWEGPIGRDTKGIVYQIEQGKLVKRTQLDEVSDKAAETLEADRAKRRDAYGDW